MIAKPVTQAERDILNGSPYAEKALSKIHPDGKPWDKCCEGDYENESNCQCFCRKPKAAGSRYDYNRLRDPSIDRCAAEGGRFFCVHRTTEDGYYRECAGWAAKFGHHNHGETNADH